MKTIIPDVFDKISTCLADLKSTIKAGVNFTTVDIYNIYITKFSSDFWKMEARKRVNQRCHSLRGYLNGMIVEYQKKAGGAGMISGPAINFLSPLTYQFK